MLLQSPHNSTCLATRLGRSLPQLTALRPLWVAFAMRPRHVGSQWAKASAAKSSASGNTLSARPRSMLQLSWTCLENMPSLRQRVRIDAEFIVSFFSWFQLQHRSSFSTARAATAESDRIGSGRSRSVRHIVVELVMLRSRCQKTCQAILIPYC